MGSINIDVLQGMILLCMYSERETDSLRIVYYNLRGWLVGGSIIELLGVMVCFWWEDGEKKKFLCELKCGWGIKYS